MAERVVLFGVSELAMLAHSYLTYDSPHDVAAFTVERAYARERELLGLPIAPFEEVESLYPPDAFKLLSFASYRDTNRFRGRIYDQGRLKGYQFISYVSSKAVTWPDLTIGPNTVICEAAVVNPHARIGKNVVIGPGALVGHHAVVNDHCFVGPHAVILGGARMGPYSMLGANSTVKEGVTIGTGCFVGAGAYISHDTPDESVYVMERAKMLARSSREMRSRHRDER